MRFEQTLRGSGTNFSLTATRIHRAVFSQRAALRSSEHVQIVEDNEPRLRVRGGPDQVVHVTGHFLGPNPAVVGWVDAVVDRGRASCRMNAKRRIRGIAEHELVVSSSASRGSFDDADPAAEPGQAPGKRISDLTGAEYHVQLSAHKWHDRSSADLQVRRVFKI